MSSRHHIDLLRAATYGLCAWASFAFVQVHAATTTDQRPGSRIVFTDDAYLGIGAPATPAAVIAPAKGGAAAEGKSVVGAMTADKTPTSASSATEWLVKPEDQDLQTLLQRWVTAANWQLSWEATKPYPVKFNATLQGSFVDAVRDALLPYTRGADPIKGCLYDNNVLRVVPKPTVCKLK